MVFQKRLLFFPLYSSFVSRPLPIGGAAGQSCASGRIFSWQKSLDVTMTPWVARPACGWCPPGADQDAAWVTSSRSSLPSTTLMPTTGPVFSVTM